MLLHACVILYHTDFYRQTVKTHQVFKFIMYRKSDKMGDMVVV